MAKKEVKKVNKATALIEPVVEVLKKVAVAKEKDLFVKLDALTWAMPLVGVGVLIEHHGNLVFVPGMKILTLGDENLLAKL